MCTVWKLRKLFPNGYSEGTKILSNNGAKKDFMVIMKYVINVNAQCRRVAKKSSGNYGLQIRDFTGQKEEQTSGGCGRVNCPAPLSKKRLKWTHSHPENQVPEKPRS